MRETLESSLLSIAILYEEKKGFTTDKTATQFTINKITFMARLTGRLCYEKRGCDHK